MVLRVHGMDQSGVRFPVSPLDSSLINISDSLVVNHLVNF